MAKSGLERLKRDVQAHPRGRGRRYPEALEGRLRAYASARRAEGASWSQISGEVGVRHETLRRWCPESDGGSASPALVPVQVIEDVGSAERTVSVASASGYRVDGLTLAEAILLLRALS